MSLKPARTSITLTLLVITPVALLAWLGTYLIRDAARSTDNARQAILAERLFVANHQLLHDLRQFTDELDNLGSADGKDVNSSAARLGEHPWVGEVWFSSPNGQLTITIHRHPISI